MSKLNHLAKGVAWGSISKFTIVFFQLFFMAVMARLLEPADFGLVAIANVSLRFFSYFSQMGIAPAIIQKENLDDGDVRAALALSLGVSGVFFIFAFITAGVVEVFFEINSLAVVMQTLAINFILVGFSSISLGIMQREKRFKPLAIIEVISYIIGYGLVGLFFAYNGAGVWSLVAAFMSQTLTTTILSYIVIRHAVGLKHTKEQRKHFISYGGRYSINGFVEFLTSNIDALVIGKFLGATSAGYYNRALLLANLPVQHPANILTKALFPIMGGMSNQHDKQSISVQLSSLIVGCYTFAVCAGIYVAAPDIVLLLLGEKWLASVPILKVLVWSVGPLYVSHVISVTFDSMAELALKLRIQLVTLVVLIGLLVWLVPTGETTNIAMAIVITEWVRLLLLSYSAVRLLNIKVVHIIQIISSITIVSLVTVSLIFLVATLLPNNYSLILRLVIEVIAGVLGFLIGLWLIRFIVIKNPAINYLSSRVPFISSLLPKGNNLNS